MIRDMPRDHERLSIPDFVLTMQIYSLNEHEPPMLFGRNIRRSSASAVRSVTWPVFHSQLPSFFFPWRDYGAKCSDDRPRYRSCTHTPRAIKREICGPYWWGGKPLTACRRKDCATVKNFDDHRSDWSPPLSCQQPYLIMATNITFHPGSVGSLERIDLLKQKGVTIWLTGLSASGKVREDKRVSSGMTRVAHGSTSSVHDRLRFRAAPVAPTQVLVPVRR